MEHLPKPREITSRFEKLLVGLAVDGIDFAVVGGLAVIFNGYPRLTLDANILVNNAPENLHKLLVCLADWGEGWARELKLEDFIYDQGAIRMMEEFDLDIFTRISSNSLDDFHRRLRYLETGDVRIPYLAPEDLIFLKEGSWRDKINWTCGPCVKSSRANIAD